MRGKEGNEGESEGRREEESGGRGKVREDGGEERGREKEREGRRREKEGEEGGRRKWRERRKEEEEREDRRRKKERRFPHWPLKKWGLWSFSGTFVQTQPGVRS